MQLHLVSFVALIFHLAEGTAEAAQPRTTAESAIAPPIVISPDASKHGKPTGCYVNRGHPWGFMVSIKSDTKLDLDFLSGYRLDSTVEKGYKFEGTMFFVMKDVDYSYDELTSAIVLFPEGPAHNDVAQRLVEFVNGVCPAHPLILPSTGMYNQEDDSFNINLADFDFKGESGDCEDLSVGANEPVTFVADPGTKPIGNADALKGTTNTTIVAAAKSDFKHAVSGWTIVAVLATAVGAAI